MKTQDALDYFGGHRRISELLDMHESAVYKWKEDVPKFRAVQLAILSDGELPMPDGIPPDFNPAVFRSAQNRRSS